MSEQEQGVSPELTTFTTSCTSCSHTVKNEQLQIAHATSRAAIMAAHECNSRHIESSYCMLCVAHAAHPLH